MSSNSFNILTALMVSFWAVHSVFDTGFRSPSSTDWTEAMTVQFWQAKYEDPEQLVTLLANSMLIAAAFTFVALMLSGMASQLYGRYSANAPSALSQIMVNAKIAWFFQELPCVLWGIYYYTQRPELYTLSTKQGVILAMFVGHYVHRTFIFPFRLRGGKPTPIAVFFAAALFCTWNGYMQVRSVTLTVVEEWDFAELGLFHVGCAVFLTGMLINMHSDHILINLRKPGETGYKIPKGGMFQFVSAANLFGECVEWTGFALASNFSLPCVAFAFYTASNLIPRGIAHHRWYHTKFKGEYPVERAAIIPFIL
jgi:3-oxo-5-alpha-steroid 4-dehydrogenase 1